MLPSSSCSVQRTLRTVLWRHPPTARWTHSRASGFHSPPGRAERVRSEGPDGTKTTDCAGPARSGWTPLGWVLVIGPSRRTGPRATPENRSGLRPPRPTPSALPTVRPVCQSFSGASGTLTDASLVVSTSPRKSEATHEKKLASPSHGDRERAPTGRSHRYPRGARYSRKRARKKTGQPPARC